MAKVKQLVENNERFYPLVHADGVVFQDGSYLSSKAFANNSTITLTKGNWSDTFTTNASSNKTINLPGDDTSTLFATAEYDSNSKRINFKNSSGTVISYIDATAFVKDGMIDSVSIGNGAASGPNAGVSCLLIDFNTDSGKTDVEIPLSQIFDPSNYLTATQIQNGYVAKETGKGLSTNDYTTTEKNKLAGIAAGAEVNVQANWTETNSSSDAYIQNKPTLATVATSGSYADLSNKPTIPDVSNMVSTTDTLTSNKIILGNGNKTVKVATEEILPDGVTPWNAEAETYIPRYSHITAATGTFADARSNTLTADTIILGDGNKYVKSSSKTIATTLGSDDTTVPTSKAVRDALPTVNNATLTIQKNGTTVDTFTANASSNKTVNITVPTKTSDLTNDSGFLGESEERVISAALNDLNSRINSSDSTKEDKSNKVTSIDSSSTDTEYPSAKAVYDYALNNDDGEVISTALNDLNLRVNGNTSDITALQTSVSDIENGLGSGVVTSVTFNGAYQTGNVSFTQTKPNWTATSGYGEILNKPTVRTSIRAASSASDTDLVSEKAISSALASAGQIDSVTLNGTAATVSNKTAALTLTASNSGSGNVVTGVSISGNAITVTKGNVDTSSLESTSNKLTSGDLSSYSTNTTKYPSAKIVYDYSEAKSNKVTSLSSSSTDTQYPSAKAVYDALETKLGEEDEEVIAASLNDLNTRLEDVEDMVVFDTVPTGNSGNLVTSGAIYNAIATMTNKKQLITYTTSDTNVTNLAWDTVHKFPEMSSLTFTIAAEPNDGYSHEITIIFDSGATSTTLNAPTNVLWARNVVLVPDINYRYEINIDDSNIAVFTEAALPNT